MNTAEGNRLDTTDPRASKDGDDSGIKDGESFHTCNNSFTTRDTTRDDENEGVDTEKNETLLSRSSVFESDDPAMKEHATKFKGSPIERKEVPVSRRGNKTRVGIRCGKKNKMENQWDQFQEQTSTYSLYSGFCKPPPMMSDMDTSNEPIPSTGFLSRETMLQLTTNINNGFVYINNAFELLKQSQMELYQAKFTLERLYQSQHGDFETSTGDLPLKFEGNAGIMGIGDESCENHVVGLAGDNDKDVNLHGVESFQVQLDPFAFLEQQNVPVVPDSTTVADAKAETGRGVKKGCRSGQRRRRRPKVDYISAYDSKLAKKGIKHLVCHLRSSANAADVSGARVPVIVLDDLQPVLQKTEEIRCNVYSMSNIAKYLKPEPEKNQKLKKVKVVAPPSQEEAENMETSVTEETEDSCPKQVRISFKKPPRQNQENQNAPERKPTPPPTNTPSISAHKSDEESVIPAKKKSDNLPHWRKMRVDPKTMERVQLRLQKMQKALLSADNTKSVKPSDTSQKDYGSHSDEEDDDLFISVRDTLKARNN